MSIFTHIKKNEAFSLLELLVVLAIVGGMMGIGLAGMGKLQQVLQVNGSAKELVNEMRKSRRYAIDSVVTSNKTNSTAYYIELDAANDTYSWGECDSVGCRTIENLKSTGYRGIDVSGCVSGGTTYKYIKFRSVTGEFFINNDLSNNTAASNCQITIKIDGGVNRTEKNISVDVIERTLALE